MAFDVFVSYSHAADGQLAPALERGLQRLAKPWYRVRALRVFRDETALSANPHLWSSIQNAMDESEWFVLLASPAAVASEWVGRELEYWLATKSVDRILVAVTDGTWEWTVARRALTGTAVPSVVRDAFVDEPRHVDLRWACSETDLDLRNSAFRDAVAQLAAPVHGLAKDELESEDIRLHRRARRLARGGASLLALLVVIALVTTGFALVQRENANTQRGHAERQANVANAERVAAVAAANRGIDESQALLLAVEGFNRADTPTTRSALLGTLTAVPQLVGFMPGAHDTTTSAISPDGQLVVAGTRDGALRFWNTREPGNEAVLADPPVALRGDPVVNIAFDHDGRRLFVLHHDGRVEQWNPRTRSPNGNPMQIGTQSAAGISVSPDGHRVVVGATSPAFGSAPQAAVYDVDRRRMLGTINPSTIGQTQQPGALNAIFSPDGSTVFAAAGNVAGLDAHTLQPDGAPLRTSPAIRSSGLKGSSFLISVNAEIAVASVEVGRSSFGACTLGTKGCNAQPHTLLVTDTIPGSLDTGTGATVLDATTRQIIETVAPTLSVNALAISKDGSTVVVGGTDGTIEALPAHDAALVGPIEPRLHQSGAIDSLSLADDGQTLVSTSDGGSTVLWDLSGQGVLARVHAFPDAASLFRGSVGRFCNPSLSPVDVALEGGGTDASITTIDTSSTCASSVAANASDTTMVVSADHTSVWDIAQRPAKLLRTFGPELTPSAMPLAFDPSGHKALFAFGYTVRGSSAPTTAETHSYKITSLDGAQPIRTVLAATPVVSDANSGPNVLVHAPGTCGPSVCTNGNQPLTALNLWTGQKLGSFRPALVVDELARARRADLSGALPPTSELRGFLEYPPSRAVIDAQGRLAATVDPFGDVVLWNLQSGRPAAAPIVATGGPDPSATAIAFAPDSNELAVGRLDGTVARYTVPALRPIGAPLAGHRTAISQIAYQSVGSLVAIASADAVTVVDHTTGQLLATIPYPGPTPFDTAIGTGSVLSPNGTVQFSDNGHLLVTQAYSGVPALVWSMVPSDWVNAACNAAGRNLTRTEWTQLVGSTVPYDRTCPEWPAGT